MKVTHMLAATALVALLSSPAFAADTDVNTGAKITAGTESQRDVNQQTRIEQGLKEGELNAHETAKLEKGAARIDHAEAKSLKDGELSAAEKARIQKMQKAESKEIYQQKHDAQKGNPDSKTSQRLQGDVQRNVNQEKRIAAGEKSGALTKSEAAKLENNQARTYRTEARAARTGGVNTREEARINKSETKDSAKIYKKKHNRRYRQTS